MVGQWVNQMDNGLIFTPSFEGGDHLIEAIQLFLQISDLRHDVWGSHSGPQHLLQGFAPAVAASCCFILIGAASNNLGLMVTAGIVMIPAVLGIAKAVVFLLEKEMGLLGIS